jgi:hypothetical protein
MASQPVPFSAVKLRPDLPAALAAHLTEELRLDVREPLVSPAVSIDLEMMRAVVIPAIDQHIVHAHLAHLAEGDLLRVLGMAQQLCLRTTSLRASTS